MPQGPGAGGFFVEGDPVRFCPAADRPGEGAALLRLEQAVLCRDQLVAPGPVKARGRVAALVPAHGELAFVPVAQHLGRGDDLRQGRVDAPQPHQRVLHPAGLEIQLFFIGEVAEITAAAPGELGAVHGDASGRWRENFFDPAIGKVLAHLHQADGEHIPPGCSGDENGHSVVQAAHPQTLGGVTVDDHPGLLIFDSFSGHGRLKYRRDRPREAGIPGTRRHRGRSRRC